MRTAVIYNFLIEANIMASIAIILMLILRRTLRRQLGNTALCFGWLLVALRLLLPISLPNPLINTIRSPFAADLAIRPIAGQVKVRLSDALSDLTWRAGISGSRSNPLTRMWHGMNNGVTAATLARIYLAGVVAVALWFVLSNALFRRRMRVGRIEPISGQLEKQYLDLCEKRGVKPVPVFFTDPLPSACLVGLIRPYIALPLTASPAEAIQVLTHEVCHLKNRDPWWSLLRLVCCAVHWFNPLVWLAATQSRIDAELRCDDRVVAGMDASERQAYAGVLVLAAARRSAPGIGVLATGMTMTGRRLKTRVNTVMRGGKPLRALSISFAVMASMLLTGAFATAEMPVLPRILRTHPSLNVQRVTSEAQAEAYTRQLFALDALGNLTLADRTWENIIDTRGDAVTSRAEAVETGKRVEAQYDLDGNVWGFSAQFHDWYADNRRLTDEEEAALAENLKQFLRKIHPALGEVEYSCEIGDYGMASGGARCVTVALWPAEVAGRASGDTTVWFEVQFAPVVRILSMSVTREAPDGNG